MLYVHKASRGVLQTANRPPGLSPAEWWEVRGHTALGRKILKYYPCFDTVTNEDGALLDIIRWGKRRIKRLDRGGPADPKRDWRHRHDKTSRYYRRKCE